MSFWNRFLLSLSILLVLAITGSAGAATVASTPYPNPKPPVDAANPPEGVSPEQAATALKLPEGLHIHDYMKEEGWKFFKEKRGVKIYARLREGSKIKEGIGIGALDAPPCRILQIMADHHRLPEFMPYIQMSLVKCHNFNEDWYCQYLDFPAMTFLSDRKYNLHSTLYNISKDGVCELLFHWEKDTTTCPCTTEDYKARMKSYSDGSVETVENLGYWHLKGLEGNTKTLAEYYVFTDPGGSVPVSLQNWFVDDAIANVFEAAQKRITQNGVYPDCQCSPTEIP